MDPIETARRLRREPTDAERLLWYRLRARRLRGHKFRRQHPVGPYFADFACVEAMLVVELDGGQHAARVGYDERRTAFLKGQGFRVLRFWNNDVFGNLDGVLSTIVDAIENPLTPTLSPFGGEGVREDPLTPALSPFGGEGARE